jgi:hypothetical protein
MKTTKALLLFSLVLLSVCLILSSCKKEAAAEPGINYCNLDTSLAGLAEWAFFKQGSTWVYRDLVSGRTKTMFVDQSYFYIDHWGEPSFINLLRTSGEEGGYYWGYDSGGLMGCNAGEDCMCKSISIGTSESGEMFGSTRILPYFHFKGQKFGSMVPIGKEPVFNEVESINDRLEFMGSVYTDLVRVHISYDVRADWSESRIWWKKNLGPVRFDFIDRNEIWMLVHHNVQQ